MKRKQNVLTDHLFLALICAHTHVHFYLKKPIPIIHCANISDKAYNSIQNSNKSTISLSVK